MRTLITIILLSLLVSYSSAEVVDSAANGFTITNHAAVQSNPTRAYAAIVKIGSWWSSEHTFFGNAKHMSLDPNVGGCFCEVDWKQQVRHGTVIFVDPGKLLRISTALGPFQDQGIAGVLTFVLSPTQNGSDIEMTYRAGGYFPGGLEKIAPVVNSVLSEQIQRLKRFIDTGTPEEKKM